MQVQNREHSQRFTTFLQQAVKKPLMFTSLLQKSGNPAKTYQQDPRMFTILPQCFTPELLGEYESLLLSIKLNTEYETDSSPTTSESTKNQYLRVCSYHTVISIYPHLFIFVFVARFKPHVLLDLLTKSLGFC